MNYNAVMFDYDGVTADSPSLNYAAWAHAFAAYGVKIGRTEYFSMEGHGPLKIAENLCYTHRLDIGLAAGLRQAKEEHMRTLGEPAIYPEIPGLLSALQGSGVTMALVTGASRARIDSTLPSTLRSHYEVIITSDDVKHTKPHPEPYLKAALIMGVRPAEALVVENAPLGVASALAGGFHCAAILTTLSRSMLKGAQPILADHGELREWLFPDATE